MKKVERSVKTDRFEAVLVYWEPESSDFYPSTPLPAAPATTQESYLMIGPPGGPLARIDGVDASIVMLLLHSTMTGGPGAGRFIPRGMSPVGCGV